jgi:hypothetical protein
MDVGTSMSDWPLHSTVAFDLDKISSASGTDILYYEPVLGWQGTIAREFDAHVTVEFNVTEKDGSRENYIYVVPKKFLRVVA